MHTPFNPALLNQIIHPFVTIDRSILIFDARNVVIASSMEGCIGKTMTEIEKDSSWDGLTLENVFINNEVIATVGIAGQTAEKGQTAATLVKLLTILHTAPSSALSFDGQWVEYETIFDLIPAQIWIKDTHNRFLRVNKQVEKNLGMPAAQIEGRTAEELFPEYAQGYYDDDLIVIHSGNPRLDIVEKIKDAQGETHWLLVNKIPSYDDQNKVNGILALVVDITAAKTAERDLLLWAAVFENSGEAIFVTDTQNRILTVNRAFTQMTGYTREEIVGQEPSVLKSGYHDHMFYRNMWISILQTGSWQGELWDRRKDGTIYPKWITIVQIKNVTGETIHYLATFSDISERKASEQQIYYLAHHDALTGLPNRSALTEKLNAAIEYAHARSHSVALIAVNVDRFKNVNDSLGHNAGDFILQDIAFRLKRTLNQAGMVSRFGGDSFTILMPDITSEALVIHGIDKIFEAILEPFNYDGMEIQITVSVGISIFPRDGSTAEVLLKNAETALHQAKAEGRSRYKFFKSEMNTLVSNRFSIEAGLRNALKENQFALYYQPQVNIATQQLVGVEALIRWFHPQNGLIPPGDFISIAEDTGLIVPIGNWVLTEACRQSVEWTKAGLPPFVTSVNISAIQFHHKDFLQQLADVLAESGMNPRQLELEVTESVVMREVQAVAMQLKQIKEMGVSLAIDDFGTGFSSLSYLRHFPIDRLKIDQSFIHDLTSEPINHAITETIITLGKSLRAKTIAEGVETPEQLSLLRSLKCDEVQGYYYCKPIPAPAFADWLQQRGQ